MLTQLDKPIEEIATYAPATLYELSAEIANAKAATKKREDALNAALERIFGQRIAETYTRLGKDTGVARVAASNTLNLKIDREPTVIWDQDKLRTWHSQQCPFIKREEEFSIPAAVFKTVPADQQKVLATARTVKVGRNKFTFEEIKLGE